MRYLRPFTLQTNACAQSLNPLQGMDYQTLLKVYRAVPGSVDDDMQQFFKRNPALLTPVDKQQHTDLSASVPEGYVEVAREDGSTYWTDRTMTHVIEGRPAPVVNSGPSTESKTSGGSPSKPSTRAKLSARDMIRHIFLYFDRDGDGFLNHPEMQRFSRVINNTTRTLTRQDWLKICQYWVCNVVPVTGWCCTHLTHVSFCTNSSLCLTFVFLHFLACTSAPSDSNNPSQSPNDPTPSRQSLSPSSSSPGQGATHKGITAEHLRQIYESDTGSTLATDYATIQSLEREHGRVRASVQATVAGTTPTPTPAPTPKVDSGG